MEVLAKSAWLERVDLSAHGFYRTPDITGSDGPHPFSYFCYGAACSEVEVDVLTGDWHALRVDITMDVGNPMNPAIDIGQVIGFLHSSPAGSNSSVVAGQWHPRVESTDGVVEFFQCMMPPT